MNNTLTNKFVAFLTLLSGLSISAVAVYYSVSGLTAIFAAAVIPIIIMGIALEIGKLVATVWLKQNWNVAPWSIKILLTLAVVVLMLITSMGIFGFLSKAHSDQSLVSGDVAARIAVYDEKIKVEKETVETDRKALRQMDDAVDQLMSRSTTENGADKAVALRRSQHKERVRLLAEINDSQKTISKLNEERAPIAAESRKVEAEVGPIKYIAAFFYGNTDQAILERAVTWVIITLILVFDPLAVILLLASQHSFQKMREKVEEEPGKEEELPVKEDSPKPNEDDKMNPVDLWNTMIKAVEVESAENKPAAVELPPKPHVWKTTVYHPPSADEQKGTTSSSYVQNEEQEESGNWKNLNKVISEKEYLTEAEKNIEEMIKRVRSGVLPFYKVPHEIKEEVKKGLDSDSKNNTNNPA
jgi:hypothetical protein